MALRCRVEGELGKLIGFICAALALGALAWDYWRGPQQGGEMEFSTIAEGWAELHRPSLIGLNSFTEKNLSPEILDAYVLPALNWNAALTFTIMALVFFYIGKEPRSAKRRGIFPRNDGR